MSYRISTALLLPAMLVAQAPAEDTSALVATYTAVVKNYAAHLKEGKAAKTRLPMDATPEGLSVLIAHETRPGVRQLLLQARYFMLRSQAAESGKLPDNLANFQFTLTTSSMLELAGQMTPDSPALDLVAAVDPEFLGWIAWHASGGGYVKQTEAQAATKAFAFFDQVFEKHPSRAVKLLALESSIELSSRPRMIAEVRKGVARLQAFEPASPAIAKWNAWLVKAEVEDKIAPKAGNPMPAFKVTELGKGGKVLGPATFKGKYWILDFWATWCGPCKGELPFVHKAYAKYHDAGLEILSVSSDKKVGDIAAFRRNPATPMPWHHAFPEGKEREALMNLFQVRGIPHVILVGPDGKIITVNDGLRGEDLDRTLGKLLKTK
ncbi:TlpA family protein disulfide reductase [Mesoterricola silvestris]|uniref:Thioredoxin domain-containing protein n=1 Tax=Mesoterricola silvestris TaxID=2927979 RepID=A0AA48GU90_9BACT|nr:TlpA disulfide reductase family protein [Mesoterricola silvestris]BDU71881.1 hypothetical protein METEAL_10550 [Mesoterricola silvestris]